MDHCTVNDGDACRGVDEQQSSADIRRGHACWHTQQVSTRRLVLVRHAKAEAGSPDVQRPLARRGVRDAGAVGQWLADRGLVPDRAVVSPARRAVQTWDIAAGQLGDVAPARIDDLIYVNTVDDLLAVIHPTSDEVSTLLLVGHNPSMVELATVVDDGSGDENARAELSRGYPTSGVAVFALDTSWVDVGRATGTLTAFAAPRG